MRKDLVKYNRAEKEVMKVLTNKKTIYELTVWVRDHAKYLEWFCNCPKKEISEVLSRYMSLSYQLYQKGLNNNKEAVDDFRHLSMLATLAMEECCGGDKYESI